MCEVKKVKNDVEKFWTFKKNSKFPKLFLQENFVEFLRKVNWVVWWRVRFESLWYFYFRVAFGGRFLGENLINFFYLVVKEFLEAFEDYVWPKFDKKIRRIKLKTEWSSV